MTNWLSDLDWSSMYNTWLISNVNPHPVLNPRFVVNREFIVNPQFVVNGEFIIIPQFFVNPQFDVNGEFQPLIHRQSRIHRQRRIYRQTWICPQFSIHRESQFINLSSTNVLLQTAVCLVALMYPRRGVILGHHRSGLLRLSAVHNAHQSELDD